MSMLYVVINFALAVVGIYYLNSQGGALTDAYLKSIEVASGTAPTDAQKSATGKVKLVIAVALPGIYLLLIYPLNGVGVPLFALIGLSAAALHYCNRDHNPSVGNIAHTVSLASFLGLLQLVSGNFTKWGYESGKNLFQTIGLADMLWILVPPAIGIAAGFIFAAKTPVTTTAKKVSEHKNAIIATVLLIIAAVVVFKMRGGQ